MRVAGTVIWSTDLIEDRNREGGGKGRPATTSYSYSASFAVALSARPVRAVHRIWADGKLLRGAVSLLIGPAYALAGRTGIAVLLAAFHLAAVAVFACGLRTALPDAPRPARLLVSLVVNLATAVWMPRGGYWYQGTVGGTIYHNTTYIMLAPFALLAMLAFYRVWPTMRDDLDLRAYAVYTVLLTVATSFKASLMGATRVSCMIMFILAGAALLTKTMALELAPVVRVNCVCPGYVLTPMQKAEYTPEQLAQVNEGIPMKRHAEPEEIGALYAFLASSDAAYITGADIRIDGGETAGLYS